MAYFIIREYSTMSLDTRGYPVPVAREPAHATQVIAIGASSAQSELLQSTTRFVELTADRICNWAIGTNPTALPASSEGAGRLIDGQVLFYGVNPDIAGTLKFAVIEDT